MSYMLRTPGMHCQGEGDVSLRSVNVEATLHNLMSEVVVTQTYQNLGNQKIEAVYTFPLPVKAVLLSFVITIYIQFKIQRRIQNS